ncbi:MAG TPA: carboxypeptidase regulatory-like domain-containing protein [Clostridia bacterium]|nr:carboxypeptidase regulatory-like domain-containing protein [Clostridia bacterium]
MKQSSIVRTLVTIVAILVLVTGAAFAQTSKGTLGGTITDNTGAVIAGASVTAKGSMGETRTAVTGPNGQYRMDALTPDTYTVSITMQGFAPLTISKVEVTASTITSTNGKLQIGGNAETVTVEASATRVQTESGELSHNIQPKEITELPILGLNPISLVLTQPGVVANSAREKFTNGVSFSVNGTRPRSNNFLIDGQDNNDTSLNGQSLQPQNAEAIGEVVILTNSYAAEFGRGGGSVTNVVTKGGTNQFHGSLWELHQNSALEAIPAEDGLAGVTRDDMEKYRENTYGFAIGGPVKKDKLFFFATSQWDKTRSSAQGGQLTIPTEQGVATLKSLGVNSRVDQLLQAIGGLRGKTNFGTIALGDGRPAIEVGTVQRGGIAQVNDDVQWNARVDWLATSKDSFSFRYIFDDNILTPDFYNNGSALPGYDTEQGGRKQNLGITWVRTLSQKMVNEFRFSFGRMNAGFWLADPNGAAAQQEQVTIANLLTYGVNAAFPQGRLMNTFQYQDALSFSWGNHTTKIGADVSRAQVKANVPFNSRGTIGFTDGGGYTALANFIDNFTGASAQAGKVFGSPVVYPNQLTQAYYIQDTWKLRPNLTLDYGIRYEYYGTPINVLPYPAIDMNSPFMVTPVRHELQPDYNNFGPRVGVAYTPRFWNGLFGDNKTVIRAGYGMFYDTFFNNILVNSAASSPNVMGTTIQAPVGGRGLSGAMELIPNMNSVYSPTAAITGVANNLVAPNTHQWNLDIQRELPGSFTLTTAYVGSRGIRLFVNDQLNPGVNGVRLNPNVGNYGVRTNSGDSIYHGLNVKVDRRFTNGLLFRAAYTYSKMIDTGSEVFTSTGGSSYAQSTRALERGLSAYDRRQRLVLTYVYDIPNMKFSKSFLNGISYIARDWQLSGTTSFQAGAPETVYINGTDTDQDLNAGNNRPNLGNPAAPITRWAIDGSFIKQTAGKLYDGHDYYQHGGTVTPVTVNDVHWLIQPGIGNVGRNTLIGPGRQDWDMGIVRRFKLPMEGHQFEFRTEMFNIFNHPNLGNVNYNVRSKYFGDEYNTREGGRTLRFKVKYSF